MAYSGLQIVTDLSCSLQIHLSRLVVNTQASQSLIDWADRVPMH